MEQGFEGWVQGEGRDGVVEGRVVGVRGGGREDGSGVGG